MLVEDGYLAKRRFVQIFFLRQYFYIRPLVSSFGNLLSVCYYKKYWNLQVTLSLLPYVTEIWKNILLFLVNSKAIISLIYFSYAFPPFKSSMTVSKISVCCSLYFLPYKHHLRLVLPVDIYFMFTTRPYVNVSLVIFIHWSFTQ